MGLQNIDDESFEKEVIQHQGSVVLDFNAKWCVPCNMVGPIFEEIATDYKDVKFAKVDVDDAQATCEDLGIRSIPAFLVMKDGKEVSRVVGAQSRAALKTWIEKHI